MTAPELNGVFVLAEGDVIAVPLDVAHAVSTVRECVAGGWLGVCVCCQVRQAETEDGVWALLAAHIDGTEVA